MMVWHRQSLCPENYIGLVPILNVDELVGCVHDEKTPGAGGD